MAELQADRDALDREAPRIEFCAERLRRVLGLDDERIHTILLDDRAAETVAEKNDGEPHWPESHHR